MSRRKTSAVLICFLLIFLLLLICAAGVSADSAPRFSLGDTSAAKDRLLSVPLCIENGEGIASFVAEIGYSAEDLEYRSASATDGAEVFVNSSESGKFTLVYLCEDGATSCTKSELLSLVFKVISAGDSQLTLSVRDVIDKAGKDTEFTCADIALVTVKASMSEKTNQSNEKEIIAEAEQANISETESNTRKTEGNLRVFGKNIDSAIFLPLALLIILVAISAVCIAYHLGRKNRKMLIFPR